MIVLTAGLIAVSARAALTHRYSFSEAAGTTVADSVGGANGTVYGGDYPTWPGNGTMQFNGYDNYVQLPDSLLSTYTNVTVEMWVNDFGSANWARVFDFGNQSGTAGSSWFYYGFPGTNPNTVRAEINPPAPSTLDVPRPAANSEHHVVIVVNAAITNLSIYIDGVLAGTKSAASGYAGGNPSTVGATTNTWLGQSQFATDPHFWGALDEFRTWDQALDAAQIAASYQAGPDTVSTNAGSLNSVVLSVNTPTTVGGIQSPGLTGDYANLTNGVNLANAVGVSYTSSDTNVIVVTNGTSLLAVGTGTASVTANYQGVTDTKAITVINQPAVLVHRYSFDDAVGSSTVADAVGGADGALTGGTLGGSQITLNGAGDYITLPAGILPNLTNATFQFWTTWNSAPASGATRCFDFGTNNGTSGVQWINVSPDGQNASLQYPRFVINDGTGGTPANAATAFPVGQQVCVTAVYNDNAQVETLYLNGANIASTATAKHIYKIQNDAMNYIGKSQFAADPTYNGSFDEFRIFNGAMDAFTVAITTAAGPDQVVTDPGALLAIRIVAGTTNLDAHGTATSFAVYADYANVTNVNVTTQSGIVILSSDTNVARVVGTTLRPAGAGVATIAATFQSFTGTLAVNVTDASAWPTLAHRYSFSETAGPTVTDSVAGANGTLVGTGTFGGGKLTLPGGPANSDGSINPAAGYVDLPNDLVAALPSEVTFEVWFTWSGGNINQRVFDFGNNDQSEDIQGTGYTYLMMTPSGNGSVAQIEYHTNAVADLVLKAGAQIAPNTEAQMILTHDADRNISKLYINGRFIASGSPGFALADLPQVNNWLGRSQWKDPYFAGSFDDFRIWNGAFTDGEVSAAYAAGPNNIIRPALTIGRSGTNIVLQWPANATNYVLQSTVTLAPAAWSPVVGTPTVVNGVNQLTVTPATTQFYRLQ